MRIYYSMTLKEANELFVSRQVILRRSSQECWNEMLSLRIAASCDTSETLLNDSVIDKQEKVSANIPALCSFIPNTKQFLRLFPFIDVNTCRKI